MKKTLTIFGFLLATSALFSQSISANFQTDMEGWTSPFTRQQDESEPRRILVLGGLGTRAVIEWSNLFAPMNDRGGIHFSGENENTTFFTDAIFDTSAMFLFVQKELLELLPNTKYRITFNTNWLAWLDTTVLPISVKVGARNRNPVSFSPGTASTPDGGITGMLLYGLSIARSDFVVAGQLTPNENGLAFTQNINNFDNAFYVNTDDEGRLFLMIGIETENPKIENVFLNTLRVVLREVRETEEVQEDSKEKTEDEDEVEEDSKEMSSRT